MCTNTYMHETRRVKTHICVDNTTHTERKEIYQMRTNTYVHETRGVQTHISVNPLNISVNPFVLQYVLQRVAAYVSVYISVNLFNMPCSSDTKALYSVRRAVCSI